MKTPLELQIDELKKKQDIISDEIERLENQKNAEGSIELLKKIRGSTWKLSIYGDVLEYKRNSKELKNGTQDDKLASYLLNFNNASIFPHGSLRLTDVIEIRGDDGRIRLLYDPPSHTIVQVKDRVKALLTFAKAHDLIISYELFHDKIKDLNHGIKIHTDDLALYKNIEKES